jgi:hypothetical protein
MKITICKDVDMTEEQQEIYDKGFRDGVESVKEDKLKSKTFLLFIILLVVIYLVSDILAPHI